MNMNAHMNSTRKLLIVLLLILLPLLLFGCENDAGGLKDGYYTAQVAEPDHGWTDFMTICVSNGKIVTAEFQAKNAGGFIKAWDMDYMRVMNASDGTYPNEYVRVYTQEFLEAQSPDIDAVSGATESYNNFKKLAAAVIEQAEKGDKAVRIVDVAAE
jgi:major membrane immunogen (membrane-anchored lipoprotein)